MSCDVQFYGITSFDIGGFCVCNGYADQCIVDDDTGLYHCDCLNGTCGQYCDHCCPLYNNAPYTAHGRGCVGKSVLHLVTSITLLGWYDHKLPIVYIM